MPGMRGRERHGAYRAIAPTVQLCLPCICRRFPHDRRPRLIILQPECLPVFSAGISLPASAPATACRSAEPHKPPYAAHRRRVPPSPPRAATVRHDPTCKGTGASRREAPSAQRERAYLRRMHGSGCLTWHCGMQETGAAGRRNGWIACERLICALSCPIGYVKILRSSLSSCRGCRQNVNGFNTLRAHGIPYGQRRRVASATIPGE